MPQSCLITAAKRTFYVLNTALNRIQTDLVVVLNLHPLLLDGWIFCHGLELRKLRQILQPALAVHNTRNQRTETRIRLVDPSNTQQILIYLL